MVAGRRPRGILSLVTECPSKNQVKKAGSTLRRVIRGDLELDDKGLDSYLNALGTIEAWRAAHAKPLVSANNGLRSMLRTEGCPVEVSQRLKRMSTIVDKLEREPTLALPNMQDIGGVRAIVPTIEEIRRVETRLKKNRTVVGYSDYIKSPRASGYRGVHVVVLYGQDDRQIEVQLRTPLMHEWAITVERLSSVFGENLKQDGTTSAQSFMARVSEAMALEERGEEPPHELVRMIVQLRHTIQPILDEAR